MTVTQITATPANITTGKPEDGKSGSKKETQNIVIQ